MKKGFSLLETVFVLAIIGIFIALTTFSFAEFRASRSLGNSVDLVHAVLTEARSRTTASVDASTYGVHFLSDRIVLFRGGTYSAAALDNEIFFFEQPVVLVSTSFAGGGQSVIFERLTGFTDQPGTIRLGHGEKQKTLTVLSSGILDE